MKRLFEQFNEDLKKIPLFNKSVISSEKEDNSIKTINNMFNCIDLTSLNTDDTYNKIEDFCKKVKEFPQNFKDLPNVAAVCVYSKYSSILKKVLGNTDVKRAVVSACFPTSQTSLSNKIQETNEALLNGANEIDIVIDIGEFLEENYDVVGNEILAIKNNMKKIDEEAKLKVILETGMLDTSENIWKASLLAMEAGADFIKTSTGKHSVSATPEAVWIMAHAIKAFYVKKGKLAGLKPSGGIVTVSDATTYYTIAKNVLGDKFMNNKYFRFGASRLANNLLTEIERLKGSDKVISYF